LNYFQESIMKVVVAGALSLGFAASLLGQSPARPAFEAASVKQEASTLPNGISGGVCHGSDMPGPQVGIPGMVVALGRCRYAGARIKQLINNAYGGIAADRIVGIPGSLDSLPFTIDAKAEEDSKPTSAQLRQMLQVLIEERFKMKYHRETKEVDGYALVIGKNGIKLKESAEGTRPGSSSGPDNIHGSLSMASLAGSLTRAAGKPVTDKTGLTARYDIDIKFTPETVSAAPTAADPTGQPSIFTAVQELGLRLEPNKTSIELFVIDSIEKPEAN
jgi:uncharacterized protein (TIGR03435 family)